jgi:hypothetical protein
MTDENAIVGYGYEDPQSYGEVGGIEEAEPIKIMFLERTYPSKYMAELNERNMKNAEECTLLGIDFVPKAPSFKEGGVAWKYAVVQRQGSGEGINEKILVPNDHGMLDEPKYTYTGVIQQLPPNLIYEKRWDLGMGGNQQGTLYKNTQFPAPARFLPPVWPPYDFHNKRKYEDIPDSDTSIDAQECRQREKSRKEAWNGVIGFFNSLQELDALKILEMSIAYRYLIGNVENGSYKYIRPAKGLTMELRRGPVKNKYMDIEPYLYNKDTKLYEFFVDNVKAPDDTAVYIADMIVATREANIQKRIAKGSAPTPVDPQF